MADEVTIKVPLAASLLQVSRGQWVAQVGRFEGRGSKADAQHELAEQVARAVSKRDLGSTITVGVGGGEVHVLASRYDGEYEISRAPLPSAGETRLVTSWGPSMADRGNAQRIFADRVESAHQREHVRTSGRSMPDAEAALRRLAEAVGLESTDDWRDVAQRVALAMAEQHRRGETADRRLADVRLAQDLGAAVETPEGRALARLLGLRGSLSGGRVDPSELRREALAILRDAEGERWTGSLADARKPSQTVLRALDGLLRMEGLGAAVQERIDMDGLVAPGDLEEVVADRKWPDEGPLDDAIAEAIREDSLPKSAAAALKSRLECHFDDHSCFASEQTEDLRLQIRNSAEALGIDVPKDDSDVDDWNAIVREIVDAASRSAKPSTREHLPGCRLELDENGDDAWACASDRPEAVHEQVARLKRDVAWLRGEFTGDPINMPPEARVAHALRDAAVRVEERDSFEGSIGWTWDTFDGGPLHLYGSYRIGNSAGQGGMRLLGEYPWVQPPAIETTSDDRLALLRDELSHRGLLAALPPHVRALIEEET